MSTIIIDPLSPESVLAARKELNSYRRKLNTKARRLAKKLTDYGADYASVYFSEAKYDYLLGPNGDHYDDGVNDIVVTPILVNDDTKAGGGITYKIEAKGTCVAYVEFGAGVFFNGGGDPYHDERPEGIDAIGERGKGYGKYRAWWFEGDGGPFGEGYVTRGTEEQPGIYLTAKQVREYFKKAYKEVFRK